MARVVLVTSEMAGRINMMCELALRLEAAGHDAAVTSPVDIGDRVLAQGVRYLPLPPALDTPTTLPVGGDGNLLHRAIGFLRRLAEVRTVGERRRSKVDAMQLDHFTAMLTAESPDLVAIDVELPAHIMAACAFPFPVVVWTSMLALWKRPGVPPLGSGVMPGAGWRGTRLGIEWTWLVFRARKWLRRQRLRITRLGEDQMSVLRTVAADASFPLGEEVDVNQWLIPFTYRTLPTISFNAQELEFPHDPPPHVSYAGPVLPRDGARPHPDVDQAATRRTLDELFARRRSGRAQALVYCSFGAWHQGDDRAFLRRILDAVGTHPEWDVVVGLGGRLDPETLAPLPPNVHPLRWAPQLEILAEADCAIHHGGISTVNECITRRVPMVVYPFDFMDQPGNAARIAYHGIGEVGDRDRDTAVAIVARIERLVLDAAVRERLVGLSEAFAAYENEDRAVKTIEQFLAE